MVSVFHGRGCSLEMDGFQFPRLEDAAVVDVSTGLLDCMTPIVASVS